MSLKEEIALLMAQYYDESVDNTNVVPSEHDLFLAEMLMLAFDIKRKETEWVGPFVDTTKQDAELDQILADIEDEVKKVEQHEEDQLTENLRAAARNDRVFGFGYGVFD